MMSNDSRVFSVVMMRHGDRHSFYQDPKGDSPLFAPSRVLSTGDAILEGFFDFFVMDGAGEEGRIHVFCRRVHG